MDVSVIIPTYNAESTIAAAVMSVISATSSFNVEILIIDDSSSDGTLAQIESLRKIYKGISVFNNHRKAGPAGARNTGILHSTGNFIAFLDADDVWHSNHLIDSLKILNEQACADAILNNQDVIGRECGKNFGDWFGKFPSVGLLQKKFLRENIFLVESNLANFLLSESFLHVQSMIIRRASLIGTLFDENLKRSEDRDFGIQLSIKNLKFIINLCPTSIYYESTSGISASSEENDYKIVCDRIYVLDKYLNSGSKFIDNALVKQNLSIRHLQKSYLLRTSNRRYEAFFETLKSIYFDFNRKQLSELLKIVFLYKKFK